MKSFSFKKFMKKIFCSIISLNALLAYAQPSTDIYLFDMKLSDRNISLSNPINITHRKGYDNQPSFAPNSALIYYTSAVDTSGNTEIKTYNYLTKKTNLFTKNAGYKFCVGRNSGRIFALK